MNFFAISATFMPSVYSNTSGNSRNLRGGTAGLVDCCCLPFYPFIITITVVIIKFAAIVIVWFVVGTVLIAALARSWTILTASIPRIILVCCWFSLIHLTAPLTAILITAVIFIFVDYLLLLFTLIVRLLIGWFSACLLCSLLFRAWVLNACCNFFSSLLVIAPIWFFTSMPSCCAFSTTSLLDF